MGRLYLLPAAVVSAQAEQLELRREEERVEREKAEAKKRATRDMLTRAIQLARQKRDRERHEELVCDMKLLEQDTKALDDQALAVQQRKVTS